MRQGKEGERTACSFNIDGDVNFVVKIVFGLWTETNLNASILENFLHLPASNTGAFCGLPE
ncbi:hypothetical protein [Haladaptatus halobius]|uniref:hypothetical protein n=1 Tax=Haladaptatus halobius TaxID=2884875 RepID=UPI001D0B2EDD